MAQAGTIKTITGFVIARTPDGQIRQLSVGDRVYENEMIETAAGSQVIIELNSGKTLSMTDQGQVVLDETVIAAVDAQDAVVTEVEALQAALEQGEEIPEEEPAAGNEDEEHDFDLGYDAGDSTRGEVATRLFGTGYGGEDEIIPDLEGEEEEDEEVVTTTPELSATGVEVDETDIDTANTAAGTITVDYGTPTGVLALSAAGATWNAATNTLTFQQAGTDIWQIVLDQATGNYLFTQLNAFDHGPDSNDHNALAGFDVTVTATNAVGETATTTFTAGIFDDGPSIIPNPYQEGDWSSEPLLVEGDETDGMVQKFVSAHELGLDFGEDGPGSIALSIEGFTIGTDYTWDGTTLTYYQDGVASGDQTWTIVMTGDAASGYGYVFTQLEALDHPSAGDGSGDTHDETATWNVNLTVTDSDTDTVGAVIAVAIDDDGPSISTRVGIPDVSGDETDGMVTQTVSQAFSVDFGTDGMAAADAIELSMEGLTEGTDYTWDGTTLTYYQDGVASGDQTWTIELTGDAASGYGYSFTQLEAIDHTNVGDGSNNTHDEPSSWDVRVTAKDGDDDTANETFTVTINDDGPVLTGSEIFSIREFNNGVTRSADLTDVPNVHQFTAGGMEFYAFAADGSDAKFIDADDRQGREGVGVESDSDGGDGSDAGDTGPDERFNEVNFIPDGNGGGSSEFIRMEMPDGELGYRLEVNFSEFYKTPSGAVETEKLAIDLYRSGVLIETFEIDATDTSGNAEFRTQVNTLDGFDAIEFRALNDPSTTGDDNTDFGIQDLRVTTVPGAIIVAEGQVFGDPGTDGPIDTPNTSDQFFIWDNDTNKSSHTELDGSNEPIYTITMDAQTGEWTFIQFQEMVDGETSDEIEYRIYDGEGDWTQGTLELPASQIINFENDGDTVDGGLGYDTLLVEQDGPLDFSNVDNIEKINLNDPDTDQNLTISLDDVLNMTDADNTLHITGENSDSVQLTGVLTGGWTNDGGGQFSKGGDTVTIASLDDGVDIQVNVDDGSSFDV